MLDISAYRYASGFDPILARGKPLPPVGRERCRVPGFSDRKLSWNSRQVSKLPGMVHKIYQMYSHSHGGRIAQLLLNTTNISGKSQSMCSRKNVYIHKLLQKKLLEFFSSLGMISSLDGFLGFGSYFFFSGCCCWMLVQVELTSK